MKEWIIETETAYREKTQIYVEWSFDDCLNLLPFGDSALMTLEEAVTILVRHVKAYFMPEELTLRTRMRNKNTGEIIPACAFI